MTNSKHDRLMDDIDMFIEELGDYVDNAEKITKASTPFVASDRRTELNQATEEYHSEHTNTSIIKNRPSLSLSCQPRSALLTQSLIEAGDQRHHLELFPWLDAFNSGSEEIDLQHKELIHKLNKVARTITYQEGVGAMQKALSELIDYTRYHFDTEEAYWLDELSNREEAVLHREEHDEFLCQVERYLTQVRYRHTERLLEEILTFFARWLVFHILKSDNHLSLIVIAHQSGVTIEKATQYATHFIEKETSALIDSVLATYDSLIASSVKLLREVNNSKKQLVRLKEQDSQLQEALKTAQMGHWEYKVSSGEVRCSEYVYHILGVAKHEQITSHLLSKVMSYKALRSFFSLLRRSSIDQQSFCHVFAIVRQNDGARRWIECKGKASFGSQNALTGFSGFIQDISSRIESENKINQLAYYDDLTQLPNRSFLLERLTQSVAQATRHGQHHALLFIDLDDFKELNDSFGYRYGDALLIMARTRIQSCIRRSDTLVRLNGDEFVVLLDNVGENRTDSGTHAERVAKNILLALLEPYELHKMSFANTASVGIVVFGAQKGNIDEVINQSEIAMHRAKKAGKNQLCFFDPNMQDEVQKRVALESELREAILTNAFELFFQPQVDKWGKIVGAEALIRWFHPIKGPISPGEFIPLCEKSGQIVAIGQWVVESACQQLKQWQKSDTTAHLTLAVNISYQQFKHSDFIRHLTAMLRQYDVIPSKLKLELTESMLFDDIEFTVARMKTIEKLGIGFSLDDFGTGYSSLQYIKSLPLKQLKIDQTFVRDIGNDESDQMIVRTIISMSKALGLEVIAEGVESHDQLRYLEQQGCEHFQGYYYGRPLPVSEFEQQLTTLTTK